MYAKMGWKKYVYLPLILVMCRQLLLYIQDPSKAMQRIHQRLQNISVFVNQAAIPFNDEEIVIAAVACGQDPARVEELSTMLKSAVIFSQTKRLKFLIFTDNFGREMEKVLTSWTGQAQFTWDIRPPLYPPLTKEQDGIKTEFAPCATQRLFFPQILPEYGHVLYVDTDVIFLDDPVHLWDKFKSSPQKSFGLTLENQDLYSTYYYSPIPHPENGLNSGVMLMNLNKMRANNWNEKMLTIFEEMKHYMAFCDQDLMNIYSFLYPNELEVLPCSANFRPDFCLEANLCELGENPLILHGNRAAFHDDWQFGGTFFTSYLPKMMHWFIFKNLRLVEYAFVIRKVMEKQQLYQGVYRTFNEFHLAQTDLKILKTDLNKNLDLVDSNDLCYATLKEAIVNRVSRRIK